MRIVHKLALVILGGLFLILGVGLYAGHTSRNALEYTLADSLQGLAGEIHKAVDNQLVNRVTDFKSYTSDLIIRNTVRYYNAVADSRPDLQAYFTEMEKNWLKTQPPEPNLDSAVPAEIIEAEKNVVNLTAELEEKIEFYEKEFGYPVFLDAMVTDKYGGLITYTGPREYYSFRNADWPWWQKAKQDGLFLGEVAQRQKDVYLPIAFAINNRQGEFAGVLKISLNMRDIGRILEEIEQTRMHKHQDTQCVLLDPSGRVLYSTAEYTFRENKAEQVRAITQTPGQGRHVFEDETGKDILALHKNMSTPGQTEPPGWMILVRQNTHEFFQPVRALRTRLALFSLSLALAGLFFGWLIARSISRPLQAMNEAVKRIGRGEMAIPIYINGNDEIGEMARSLKKMAAELDSTTVSRRYMNEILLTMKESVIVLNTIGVVETTNDATLKLLGYDMPGFLAQHIDHILVETDQVFGSDASGRLVIAEGASSMERTYISKDGDRIPVLLSVTMMHSDDGTARGIVCVARDISERKEIMGRLKRYTEQLEDSNKELQNYAYLIAHYLRAPLVNMWGFAAELSTSIKSCAADFATTLNVNDDAKKDMDSKVNDLLSSASLISSSAHKMNKLLDSILHVSQLESRNFKPVIVDMNRSVGKVIDKYKNRIAEKSIQVEVEDLAKITADQKSMEQVMDELIKNALTYLAGDRPGHIVVKCENRSDDVVFHVEDNGRGIFQEDTEKIFDMFKRSGEQDTPGDGVGLSYCKVLIRRHGGRIWCESELDKGSVFSFSLPHELYKTAAKEVFK